MSEEIYRKLIKRINEYYPQCDFELVKKAYDFAQKAHEGQKRESGEPFIVHPLEVAYLIAQIELDCTSVVAGLLHDILEDTYCTLEQIRAEFGEEVALIVDGVTKLERIPYTTKEDQQVENLRKMFLSMAKDIRVILIKLADRIHNMRTLKYLFPEKQIEKAKETMEIYAPLAHRLGMYNIKWELEDLSLRYIDPKGYYDLVGKIAKKRKEREAFIKDIIATLKEKLAELHINNAMIEGRPKHFYSIYRKMREQNKTIDQIYDLFAVRIVVDSIHDCYGALGLVHELYKPMPGRFKDYIGMPKQNMYQSLHTTLIGNEGIPFEVQIRTLEMHKIAEYGIAAHWRYKEGSTQQKDDMDSKLVWLRQLLDWQKEMRDAKEFMEALKIDLFTDEVFVFTPKGDVINLPADSTPIDFAYSIHSAVGNKMVGAKANGRMVSLEYKLSNGDIIEIMTSSNNHGPSMDWLNIVKSTQAKNKILQWFKKERREENLLKGKDVLEKELKKVGLTINQVTKTDALDITVRRYGFKTFEDVLASIGYGGITAGKIAAKIIEEYKKVANITLPEPIPEPEQRVTKKKPKAPESGVIVKGIDNCMVRLSKCCNPLPGDFIMGYITRGRGVSVHRTDCPNTKDFGNEADRIVEVSWYTAPNISYTANIQLQAIDRNGLFVDVTNAISEAKAAISAINAKTTKSKMAVMNVSIEIMNTEQLNKIIKRLGRIEGVYEVIRSNT